MTSDSPQHVAGALTPRRHRLVVGLLAVLVVLLIIILGRWWFSPGTGEPTRAEGEPVASEVADVIRVAEEMRERIGLKSEPVGQRAVTEIIQATGVVAPNETRVAHIRLLAPGRVEQVHVRVGDRVQAGQPLLVYDNVEVGDLAGDYVAGAAGVERALAEAEVARRSLQRAAKLVEVGGLARAEHERREAEHQRALAEVTSARATMANTERKLQRFGLGASELAQLRASPGDAASWSRTTVRAPFGGVVTAADVAPGEVVDTERELFTVADLSTVWVIADVYQKDIAVVRPGQQGQITTETYPGESFAGRITYVSDVLDPGTRTAKVRCEVPNRDGRLKLQMFVTIGIPTTTVRTEAVVVPAAAVQQIDEDTVVFVQTGDDTFEKRVIQTGPSAAGWVSVVAGLATGERVVTEGAFMLKSKLKAASIGEGEEHEEQERGRGGR